MPSSRSSSGVPLGCGFALGLVGLILLTGTTIQGLPNLSAPLRLELTSAKANAALTAQSSPASSAASPLVSPPPVELSTPPIAPTPPSPGLVLNPWAAQVPEAACIPTDLPQTGRVVAVIDGETIRVLLDRDGRVYAVRYLGIEIPQATPARLASMALARNTDLTYGQTVLLVRDLSDQDNYGRLLRYVMVGRTFVNYDLVAEGYARARSSPPDTSCDSSFLTGEQHAQSAALGLWAAADPTP